jgi:signal transduction histidine kinase
MEDEVYHLVTSPLASEVLTQVTLRNIPLETTISHRSNTNPLLKTFPNMDGYIPIRIADLQIGFMVVAARGRLDAQKISILEEVANLVAISIPTIQMYEAIDRNEAVALYSRELERRRLADKIHDRPVRELTLIHGRVQRKNEADAAAIKRVIDDLRGISRNLHSPILDFSLGEIAASVVRDYKSQHQLPVHLTVTSGAQHLAASDKVSLAVFHILSESLANVVKHAQATLVTIELDIRMEHLEVHIKDDGVGFLQSDSSIKGVGLMNMQRWARIANGTLHIAPRNGTGLGIHLRVPLRTQTSLDDALYFSDRRTVEKYRVKTK